METTSASSLDETEVDDELAKYKAKVLSDLDAILFEAKEVTDGDSQNGHTAFGTQTKKLKIGSGELGDAKRFVNEEISSRNIDNLIPLKERESDRTLVSYDMMEDTDNESVLSELTDESESLIDESESLVCIPAECNMSVGVGDTDCSPSSSSVQPNAVNGLESSIAIPLSSQHPQMSNGENDIADSTSQHFQVSTIAGVDESDPLPPSHPHRTNSHFITDVQSPLSHHVSGNQGKEPPLDSPLPDVQEDGKSQPETQLPGSKEVSLDHSCSPQSNQSNTRENLGYGSLLQSSASSHSHLAKRTEGTIELPGTPPPTTSVGQGHEANTSESTQSNLSSSGDRSTDAARCPQLSCRKGDEQKVAVGREEVAKQFTHNMSSSDSGDDNSHDSQPHNMSEDEVCPEDASHPRSNAVLVKYNFQCPMMALDYKEEFKIPTDNITKGCKWSPDGTCLLVASEDQKLRLFNVPGPVVSGEFQNESWFMKEHQEHIKPAITINERELIYDYLWYPHMRSDDPQSCCLAVTCRDHPVHLWDAWGGRLICSYRSFNHLDQMVAAQSLEFSPDGSRLLCGFSKTIRVFHTSRPGRTCYSINAKEQPGIISCMSFNPQVPYVFAAGSYLGNVGLYNLNGKNLFCRIECDNSGITQVKFSADGIKLFTGARKNNDIMCWDMRNLGTILHRFSRPVTTNQRIYFDLEPHNNSVLVSGSTTGEVISWNLNRDIESAYTYDEETYQQPMASFTAHKDCVNGLSFHPYVSLIATSSGQRHFSEPMSDLDSHSSDEEATLQQQFSKEKIIRENTVKLWWIQGS